MTPLAMDISIGIDPDVFSLGPFVLTWHGFFTFVSVALAVYLVARWAREEGIVTDIIYSVAVWAIIGGIIGARAVHVIDLWGEVYGKNPIQIFELWSGGIAIFGAILGGFVGGYIYTIWANRWEVYKWKKATSQMGVAYESVERNGYLYVRPREKLEKGRGEELHRRAGVRFQENLGGVEYIRLRNFPGARIADITAPALLITMALGRVGDIINGEHFSEATGLPWGFIYTHPKVQALFSSANLSSLVPTHPAVVYEVLLDLAVLGVIWLLRGRLRPNGMTFALYLSLYSVGRFFISFLRLDKEWLLGLNQAQLISIVILAITVPLLAYKAQFVKRKVTQPEPASSASKGSSKS